MTNPVYEWADKIATDVERICQQGGYGPNPTTYLIAKRAVMAFAGEVANEIMTGKVNPIFQATQADLKAENERLKAKLVMMAEALEPFTGSCPSPELMPQTFKKWITQAVADGKHALSAASPDVERWKQKQREATVKECLTVVKSRYGWFKGAVEREEMLSALQSLLRAKQDFRNLPDEQWESILYSLDVKSAKQEVDGNGLG